ncbi:hypothetical protein HYS50_02215 [Candidatus Woesearchaeota archaeon]|nr:hypothetical protein [Candidatus Woesearchaeota archaeon]
MHLVFLLVLLLFLSGCTAYDVVKHKTFSLQVPQWEQQDILRDWRGAETGFFASDGVCTLSLNISRNSYLAVAQPLFEQLRSADPASIVEYTLLESFVFLTYQLPGGKKGAFQIISCPSGYTYLADYQCPAATFSSRQEEIDSVLGSMTC